MLANCVTLGRSFTFWCLTAYMEIWRLAVTRQTLVVWGGTRGHAGDQRPRAREMLAD